MSHDTTYICNIKYETNELNLQNRSRVTDIENRLVVAEVEEGAVDWEFGNSRQLHIEWINKKVLLYSIGNYIQYPVINHNGIYKYINK